MKIGRLEIRRSPAAKAARELLGADVEAVGSDSDSYAHTWLYSNDPNPIFRGRSRYLIYDEMRSSDPSIRAALLIRKLPARAAKWRVDPCSDAPIDKLVADACAWQLGIGEYEDGPLTSTWNEVLAQADLKVDYGSMFEEKIWGDAPFSFRDKDGDEHLLLGVQRLAPRSPRTVDVLETDPKTGEISRFKQWLPGSQEIPPSKLIGHATDREDGSWLGTSLLRSMYGPWKFKRELMISSGIGWDRFAAGIPKVTHPEGIANENRAKRIGRSIRNHERSYITHASGGEWDVEILNGAGTLADPVPLLQFYCTQIADAALEFFTSLASSQHGSRAVGDVLVEPFWQSISADAEQTASTYRKQFLRQFVTVNFGEAIQTPHLRPGRIGTRDIAILCQSLYDASNAGLDFKDVETQNAIREILELPDLPDDYEAPAAAAPGEGGPPPFGQLSLLPPALPPAAPAPVVPAA